MMQPPFNFVRLLDEPKIHVVTADQVRDELEGMDPISIAPETIVPETVVPKPEITSPVVPTPPRPDARMRRKGR
jgi:hypothetical protein